MNALQHAPGVDSGSSHAVPCVFTYFHNSGLSHLRSRENLRFIETVVRV
jgi:hypothetical protein